MKGPNTTQTLEIPNQVMPYKNMMWLFNYHTPLQGGIWETNSTIFVTRVTRECVLPERTWARQYQRKALREKCPLFLCLFLKEREAHRLQKCQVSTFCQTIPFFFLSYLLLMQNKTRSRRWAEMLAKNVPDEQILLKSLSWFHIVICQNGSLPDNISMATWQNGTFPEQG